MPAVKEDSGREICSEDSVVGPQAQWITSGVCSWWRMLILKVQIKLWENNCHEKQRGGYGWLSPMGTVSNAESIKEEDDGVVGEDFCHVFPLELHVFHQDLPKIPTVLLVSSVISANQVRTLLTNWLLSFCTFTIALSITRAKAWVYLGHWAQHGVEQKGRWAPRREPRGELTAGRKSLLWNDLVFMFFGYQVISQGQREKENHILLKHFKSIKKMHCTGFI